MAIFFRKIYLYIYLSCNYCSVGSGSFDTNGANVKIVHALLNKKWFWKTPQDLPASHPNKKPGFGNQIMIMTAAYIPEITGDYFDGLLGTFYKSYDTDKSFAGFATPKYPDVDFTVYGLIQHKKNSLAQGMIECYLRDVVRSQTVFVESYNALDTSYPDGVGIKILVKDHKQATNAPCTK